MLRIVICICVGYLFGCFSTGFFVGKLNHTDIRKYGSGNVGSTNALRTLGIKGGILTLAGDLLKAIIPVCLMRYIFRDAQEGAQLLALTAGLGVVLGHNFPFWLKFKGGKGIAATGGVIIAFQPLMVPILLLAFVLIVAVTRYVSLASLFVALAFPVYTYIMYPGRWELVIAASLFTLLAFIRHKANIVRLIHGTENKIGSKSKASEPEQKEN